MSIDADGGLNAHLVVRRGERFTLQASLTIPPCRTVALLGPNGSGKSTAVAALAGLINIDSGRIVLAGRTLDDPTADVCIPPEERRIGVVFQDYSLFPHLSVAENVAFGLRSRGMNRNEARQKATTWLTRFDLNDLAGRKPRHLSGGQAQRVALARALATEPDLLLLDEPLSALDVTTRIQSRRLLADHLDQYPGPRLLITHDPTEAFLLADTIHVIENGVVTQVGTAEEIRLRPRTPYIADLAGSNLLAGHAAAGTVNIAGHPIHIADTNIAGPLLLTIHPRAIALHRQQPEGSPRNAWPTTLTRIEHLGDRVRVQFGDPLPLTAEITSDAAQALHLKQGSPVWITIKATEIGIEADANHTRHQHETEPARESTTSPQRPDHRPPTSGRSS
jgi:molybdate transport system ATP-binding protein